MSSVKNTSFLEAVAAGIQHEKDFFDFCMKTHDELKDGPIKSFFFDLAEDSEEHIGMIEGIYKQYSGDESLPNLKHMGQVHKFQATAIQKLIKKLDRNLQKSAHGSEIEALRLALQEAEDTLHAFNKLADKFSETPIKMLFKQMANFNSERAVLLEGVMVFQHPTADSDAHHDYQKERMSVPLEAQKPAAPRKSIPKKAAKKPAKKAAKKKNQPKKKAAAKPKKAKRAAKKK
jgi:rubrerythrin